MEGVDFCIPQCAASKQSQLPMIIFVATSGAHCVVLSAALHPAICACTTNHPTLFTAYCDANLRYKRAPLPTAATDWVGHLCVLSAHTSLLNTPHLPRIGAVTGCRQEGCRAACAWALSLHCRRCLVVGMSVRGNCGGSGESLDPVLGRCDVLRAAGWCCGCVEGSLSALAVLYTVTGPHCAPSWSLLSCR